MGYNDEPGIHLYYVYFENAKSLEFKLGQTRLLIT